jgi:hypothetical protein
MAESAGAPGLRSSLDLKALDAVTLAQEGVRASMTSPANTQRMAPPSLIADTIGKAITARHPKTRYIAGYAAKPLITMKRILPDRAFDTVISRAMGLSGRPARSSLTPIDGPRAKIRA